MVRRAARGRAAPRRGRRRRRAASRCGRRCRRRAPRRCAAGGRSPRLWPGAGRCSGAGGAAGGHVVHLAVGERDDAGEAGARDVGQRAVHRGEQPGAVMPAFRHGRRCAARDPAAWPPAPGCRRPRRRASGTRSPTCIEAVSSTTSRPISGRPSRVSCTRRGPASQASSTAKASARQSAPRARRQQRRGRARRGRARPSAPSSQSGSVGLEADRGDRLVESHAYCPSRSRMAGTCTWSPL